jgi:diguanylate cyclase (GGDEF)-like protein/PAS domain S-box-containing protein
MQNMKYFITFALLLFVALSYKTYEQYHHIQSTKELIVKNESQSLAKFITAFRQTYQDTFLRNHIEIDEKTMNLLPVKTITEISSRFSSSVKDDIVIRTVSDRPRNSDNMANSFELKMIRYFEKHPEEKQSFLQKEGAFYFMRPLRIQHSCLQCHGKRDDAIPSVHDKYEEAYDYKLGDIRGLLNIKIRERGYFAALYSDFVNTLIITGLLYIVSLIIIYLLIRKIHAKEQKYTKKLEADIEAKIDEIKKQKDAFEILFEKSTDGILILDDGKFIQCNDKIVEMLKYDSKDDLLNVHPSQLSPEYQPDGRRSHEKAEEMIQLALKNGGHRFEWVHTRANGENFWVEVALTPITIGDRDLIYVNWRDITQQHEAQTKIEEQRMYLQSIIDGVDDPIMVIGEDYTAHLMNGSIRRKLDKSMISDPAHPKCYEILHHRSTPCAGDDYPCPLKNVLERKKNFTVVHNHSRFDGSNHYMELSASPLFDKEQNCIGMIEVARDITTHLEIQNELRKQKISLDYQAHHDALTGLPNRILFNDRLQQGIEKAKRNNTMLALFFIDLDQFKQINDSLGHEVGDRVLQLVAERLEKNIRKEDTLARLGGDEFTIIMEELTKVQNASLLAEKILKVLREPIQFEGQTLYISSSIGISFYPQDDLDAYNLLKYADAAMYKAKEEGRNNYQFYSTEMTEQAFERIVMKTSLLQALEKEELIVHYQPQIDVSTGKITGLEALVRWQHPVMGLVSPENFVPLAEETDLIVGIDQWVMKTAMKQVKEWYDEGMEPGILSLNLEMKLLERDDYIRIFQDSMSSTGFKPEWLELEVTEGQLMKRPEEVIGRLRQIRDMGIQIVIDDFGIGYSSLTHLKQLPIHKLKIDRSFMRDIPRDEDAAAIIKAIIALAKSLNLDVVAEGVETEAQKEFLLQNGCENIQGYYFGKPKAAAEIKKLLKDNV